MNDVNLDYLNLPKDHPIVEILRAYGEQISSKTYNNISYIVTHGSDERGLNTVSYYVVIPELNKQHKLISLFVENVESLRMKLWALSGDSEDYEVRWNTNNLTALDAKIGEILNSTIVKQIFHFYMQQINLKRELNRSWQ